MAPSTTSYNAVMTTGRDSATAADEKKAAQARRRVEALRANLRRRKVAQVRAATSGDAPPKDDADSGEA